MFGIHGTSTSGACHSGSLPGQSFVHPISRSKKARIRDVLGLDLPESQVIDLLVDSYIQAMHWYLPLLHEPTFRTRLDELVKARECSKSDQPFLMLAMVVLLIGLHFLPSSDMEKLRAEIDVYTLRQRFAASIESNFLDSFHQYNLDWISFTILLSSYYLLNRRPRRASMVMGSAVRAALDMRLDQSVNHTAMSTLEHEMRKRVGWTIYICDG